MHKNTGKNTYFKIVFLGLKSRALIFGLENLLGIVNHYTKLH